MDPGSCTGPKLVATRALPLSLCSLCPCSLCPLVHLDGGPHHLLCESPSLVVGAHGEEEPCTLEVGQQGLCARWCRRFCRPCGSWHPARSLGCHLVPHWSRWVPSRCGFQHPYAVPPLVCGLLPTLCGPSPRKGAAWLASLWWVPCPGGFPFGFLVFCTAFFSLCSSSLCQYMMAQKASSDSLWSLCSGCPAGIPSSLVSFVFLVSAGYIGRRLGLILCSAITLLGALLSALAWSENALIAARIITGLGMGGEYPLASAHSAESSEKTSDGARNVALLYLFGSGFGQALCPLVTYVMDVSGVPHELLWRWIFGIGVLLSASGLALRYLTTQNSQKFVESRTAERKHQDSIWTILSPYWRALLGTAGCWFFFDIVEYGLKQNDAAIFSENVSAYAESILQVSWSRLLVIPSLIFAPWCLTKISSKSVQLIGFDDEEGEGAFLCAVFGRCFVGVALDFGVVCCGFRGLDAPVLRMRSWRVPLRRLCSSVWQRLWFVPGRVVW